MVIKDENNGRPKPGRTDEKLQFEPSLKRAAGWSLRDFEEGRRPQGAEAPFKERRETTLGELAHGWQVSAEWSGYAPGTQTRYALGLKNVIHIWGDVPMWVLEDDRAAEAIQKWRDERALTPRAADEGVRVLRKLIDFGRKHGFISVDPTRGLQELGSPDRSHIFWSEEEIRQCREAAEQLDMIEVGFVIRFIAGTGLPIGLATRAVWSDFVEDKMIRKADPGPRLHERKRNWMPRLPQLAPLLDELRDYPRRPGVETVLVSGHGMPWGRAALAGKIKTLREAAGVNPVNLKGKVAPKITSDLQRSFVVRAMKITQLSDGTIASLMNWTPESVRTLRLVSATT